MKQYMLLCMSVLLCFPVHANELQPSIKHLIKEVKTAKIAERRLLMNQLKIRLRKMNKESRQSAMKELKKSFSKKNSEESLDKHRHKLKKIDKQHCTHQPKYRHLRHQNGQGEHRGEGNGRNK